MKKAILLVLLILSLSPLVKSQDTTKTKIVFYRENQFQGSAIGLKVFSNNEQITIIKNNSFFVFECNPGTYNLSIGSSKNEKLVLEVKEGHAYYIRCGLVVGYWSSEPEMILVDRLSAEPIIKSAKLRDLKTPFVRPKSRFGVTLHVGAGTENHIMFTNDENQESKISFGGGIGYGIKFGHEFSKFFDLAVNYNYQRSSLSLPVKNAEISFKRHILSLTPSIIIPFSDGETMRFKVGAGPSFFLGNTFESYISKYDGIDDTWTYKNATGFHINAIFETNISKTISLNYGIKYTNVSYEFDNSYFTYPYTSDPLYKPNGGSIDLVIEMLFHF